MTHPRLFCVPCGARRLELSPCTTFRTNNHPHMHERPPINQTTKPVDKFRKEHTFTVAIRVSLCILHVCSMTCNTKRHSCLPATERTLCWYCSYKRLRGRSHTVEERVRGFRVGLVHTTDCEAHGSSSNILVEHKRLQHRLTRVGL